MIAAVFEAKKEIPVYFLSDFLIGLGANPCRIRYL
jgi:hypothetical protein